MPGVGKDWNELEPSSPALGAMGPPHSSSPCMAAESSLKRSAGGFVMMSRGNFGLRLLCNDYFHVMAVITIDLKQT